VDRVYDRVPLSPPHWRWPGFKEEGPALCPSPENIFFEFSSKKAEFYAFSLTKTTCGKKPGLEM